MSAARLLVAACAALTGITASAAPVTIGPGETVIFNFDFSAAAVPAPYDQIQVLLNRTAVDPGTSISLQLFDELDGAGAATSVISSLVSVQTLIFANAIAVDGVFSLKYFVGGGSITYDPVAVAQIFGTSGFVARVPATVSGVPEPATVALCGLALAGVALASRRRAGHGAPLDGGG